MLKNNTMRFGSDDFNFTKSALLVAKQPLDTSGQSTCEGFIIGGLEPSDTTRRFIFKIDDTLKYFYNSTLTDYPYAGELDDVLQFGNTAAQLEALTSVPELVGKKIFTIIALSAPEDAAAMPAAKIAVKVRNSTEIYSKSVDTAEYELAAAEGAVPRISKITADIVSVGNASANIYCRLKLDVTGDDWSDWLDIAAVEDREAAAIQFRIKYNVTKLDGSDSVKVSSILVKHTLGAALVSGDVAEIYSVMQNYDTDLKTCYLIVKHKRLIDSRIEAYVNFRPEPLHRELIPIGISNGTLQTLALAVGGVNDTGIDQTTIQLFADGVPVPNFSYNLKTSEVTVTGISAGKSIAASYDYGHGVEEWREMTKQFDQQPYLDDGSFMTRFEFVLPDDETDKKISNVRIRLYRPNGVVNNESLGLASGGIQQFALPHAAKQETIQLNADWTYNADSQIITCVAEKDTELIISYNWIGESQEVYGWTAGWSAA